MAKGKSTWRYNKLLTGRRNYFLGGGGLGGSDPFSIDFTSAAYHGYRGDPKKTAEFVKQANANGAKIDPNNLPGSLGGGKIDTGKGGNTSQGGLFGAIGSIGMQAASDISNMINNIQSNDIIQKADNLISGVNSKQLGTQSSGDTFDDLSQDWANTSKIKHVTSKQMGAANFGQGFGQAFVAGNTGFAAGSGLGPIGAAASAVGSTITSIIGTVARNKRARKEAARVNAAIDYTNRFNMDSLTNRASNLAGSQAANLASNYAALGGPLSFGEGMGAIEYELANRYLDAKEASANKQSSSIALPNYGLKLPTFAFGGELNTQGGDFTNGMVHIDNGGSHESNPFEGVPMGVDQEGTPNLVEEGETIFNDYVFSKRLKVPKAIRDKYKMRGTKNLTFAEMSKKMAKESEERPNDPISMRGLEAMMSDLSAAQESVRNKKGGNKFSLGGTVASQVASYADDFQAIKDLNSDSRLLEQMIDGKTSIVPSWTPSKINPYNYIKKGYYGLGETPYWIKDGKYSDSYLRWVNNYYTKDDFKQHLKNQFEFYDNASEKDKKSNRYKAIDEFVKSNPEWYKNRKSIDVWDIDDDLFDQVRELATQNPGFMHPQSVIDKLPSLENYESKINPKDYLANLGKDTTEITSPKKITPANIKAGSNVRSDKDDEYEKLPTWMRYAPAVGLGISSITDALGLTNKPDYSNADAILEATKGAGAYQPVKFNPVGNYLTYKPLDRDYYINKMNAEAGATRRSLLNTSGGNRATAMAGILAADNNYLNQIGGLARQAEEYNLNQRAQVEEFNRGTNITNSQGFLQADMANQKALMGAREMSLKGTMAAAEMKERARLLSEQAKSDNLSGFITALGDIGRENMLWNWRNFNMATGNPIGEKEKILLGAKGGKIRRKKGLTI